MFEFNVYYLWNSYLGNSFPSEESKEVITFIEKEKYARHTIDMLWNFLPELDLTQFLSKKSQIMIPCVNIALVFDKFE